MSLAALKLLDTPLIISPEMSEIDLEVEWNAMVLRSKMTQKLIDAEIDWETYLDFMAQQGYEPTELMDAAEENLDFAIREGILIER